MTVYTAVNAVLEIVLPIVEASKGVIGTHSATCYERHTACLAVLVRDVIEQEMKS